MKKISILIASIMLSGCFASTPKRENAEAEHPEHYYNCSAIACKQLIFMPGDKVTSDNAFKYERLYKHKRKPWSIPARRIEHYKQ